MIKPPIEELLEKIIINLPAPKGTSHEPLKCMLVDRWYDSYLGVIVLVRVIHGQLKKNQKIRFMAAGATHTIDRVGIFSPKPTEVDTLGPGEIGFINSGIKSRFLCEGLSFPVRENKYFYNGNRRAPNSHFSASDLEKP